MKNGTYKVEFQTPRGAGGGVIVLLDGIVRGGDSAMYYLGNYQLTGTQFTATVHIGRHSGTQQTFPSVFGVDRISINATGTAGDDSARLTATSPAVPGVQLTAVLTRIGD